MESWTLAWRNLWRNRRRTMITIAGVTANVAVLIVLLCFNEGVLENGLNNVLRVTIGDAQLHAPNYRREKSFYDTISKPNEIVKKATKLGYNAAPRSFGFGLAAAGKKSSGAAFWGVEPKLEKQAFDLPSKVEKGRYLDEKTEMGAVIGKKLAKKLKVDVGDEIVVLVQSADGSMGNELLKVVGIFKAVGENIDRSAVMIRSQDFASLFAAENMIHEIAFTTSKPQELTKTMADLETIKGSNELLSWKQLLEAFSEMMTMGKKFMGLFAFIFALVAGLGVMNTMLMATHDRVKEFGVLKALGASSGRILTGITQEAFILSAFSCIFGVLIGVAVTMYLEQYGLDLRAYAGDTINFSGVSLDSVYKAKLVFGHVRLSVFMMLIICPISALYPAFKAARLDPVVAMNHV
ncbi:MAG: FtsX-like permease family protein [Myxococcota bacterium]|nr:FtsX-like permease family protein [Myxococcota bacterium]